MSDTLNVTKRTKTGTAESRRLRRDGKIPAVLYGHGEGNEHLAVSARDVKTAMRHHSKTVKLSGDLNEDVLVRDVHYDPLGIDVLHLDLIRVNLKEKIDISVPVHTRGQAVGVNNGGILLENLHEVEVRCPAGSIPDALELDVSELKLGEHLTASALQLPADVELLTDGDVVIAHIEEPRTQAEPEAAAGESEPELVGRSAEDVPATDED